MQCHEVEILIEDYHDCELDHPRASAVEEHLGSCPNCAGRLASLRHESRLYKEFGQAIDDSLAVPPSLWNGIQNELKPAPEERQPRRVKIFTKLLGILSHALPHSIMGRELALASLLVIVSVCGTLFVVHRHQNNQDIANIQASGNKPKRQSGDLQSAILSIRKAEQEYISAIATLNSIVDTQKNMLDPALAAELNKNMKIVDEAIAASKNACREHPSDPELARHMLKAYQKKVELLQSLALQII